jgi:hypothetical protein
MVTTRRQLGGGSNYLQSNREIKTIEKNEEEIKKKIEIVVDIFQEYSIKYEETRKTVKQHISDIITLAKKNEIKLDRIRDLIETAFEERSVSPRYIRRLLPDLLKDSSRIPISHKQKKELRQSLEQQTLHKQGSELESANIHSERTEIRSDVPLPTDLNTTATEESYPIIQDSDMKTLEEQLRMANTEIKGTKY